MSVTIGVNPVVNHDFTFLLNTTNNTAVAPGDYTAVVNQQYTMFANTSSRTILIPTATDANGSEGTESFVVAATSQDAGVNSPPSGDYCFIFDVPIVIPSSGKYIHNWVRPQ